MSVGAPLAGPDSAVEPLRLFDPVGLLQAKEEGFCERLSRINRENTIEFDGSSGIGSNHVIRVLEALTNEGHAALMRIIAQPSLLYEWKKTYDRDLVVSADTFLRGITCGINDLTKNEPYAPALQEFWSIYRQCREAFPQVFRQQQGELEYI